MDLLSKLGFNVPDSTDDDLYVDSKPDDSELIQMRATAESLKQQGNKLFGSGKLKEAIDCYTSCLPHIPGCDNNLRYIVYSNRAQCHIKLEDFEPAYRDAD